MMNIPFVKPVLLISAMLMASSFAVAQDNPAETVIEKQSKSISYKNNKQPDKAQKKQLMDEVELDTISPMFQQAFKSDEVQLKHNDYSLFDASTLLLYDEDGDGYHHEFSVTIDVDTLFEHSVIYADLYLSYQGGPWIYYASSNVMDIYSDEYDDTFSIETKLVNGYPTGYYDMKINVYDAQTDQYLLSYDHHNDDSLYAIPLEDSNRDSYYHYESDLVVSHGTGSNDWLGLLMLFSLLIKFRFKKQT